LHNKNKIIFLNKVSNYTYDGKVDIILSPELYWVRVFEIPIKNKSDILKVVSTFFEDFLEIEDYTFYAVKLEDDQYLCFAYLESQISQTIKNANLNLKQVSNIYFAQNELIDYNSFEIDNKYFIYQDNILLKVPKEFLTDIKISNFDMDKVALSKHKIFINKSNKYIDNKNIYVLSIVFLLISFINFGKTNIIDNIANKVLEDQENIKTEYKMLPTMMQTKSVIRTLEKKQYKQIQLRNILQKDFNDKNKKIKKVSFRNSKISYE
jgi:hypothetical protein